MVEVGGGGQEEGARAASRRHWSVARSIGGGGREAEIARNESEAERVRETKRDRIGSPVKSTFIDRLALRGGRGRGECGRESRLAVSQFSSVRYHVLTRCHSCYQL